jgi:hypothetical protein
MTRVINLWRGASVGKSTQAAHLFYLLKKVEKEMDFTVELVREFAKDYAWMKTPLSQNMQNHIFFEQLHREMMLQNNVDFIITDSPTGIGCFYNEFYSKDSSLLPWENLKRDTIECVDFWCPRVKPYNPKGRYEDEETALKVDDEMLTFLKSDKIKTRGLIHLPKNLDFANNMFDHILETYL